jgi:hypothetical protein
MPKRFSNFECARGDVYNVDGKAVPYYEYSRLLTNHKKGQRRPRARTSKKKRGC